MAKTPLKDLAADKFPLRFEEYSKLYDRLEKAAEGFSALGYPELAEEMEAVRERLYSAWNTIRAVEAAGI